MFSLCSYDFEPASLDAMKSWINAEWNKEVYILGPLLPSKPTTYGIASGNTPLSSEVEVFLDKSLEEYGPKSVAMVSSINRPSSDSFNHQRALRSLSGRYFGPQYQST